MVKIIFIFLAVSSSAYARTVAYDLNINYELKNITGKETRAIAIGKVGSEVTIPAPTLEFTEGDEAEIVFHNNLDEESSIHWHGLLVPNDQDGVPGLTTAAIAQQKDSFKNY